MLHHYILVVAPPIVTQQANHDGLIFDRTITEGFGFNSNTGGIRAIIETVAFIQSVKDGDDKEQGEQVVTFYWPRTAQRKVSSWLSYSVLHKFIDRSLLGMRVVIFTTDDSGSLLYAHWFKHAIPTAVSFNDDAVVFSMIPEVSESLDIHLSRLIWKQVKFNYRKEYKALRKLSEQVAETPKALA
jgi:hypothetical protein